MKPENKIFIKTFLTSGLIFAVVMVGFDYLIGDEFNVIKALIYFICFGALMGYLARRNYIKEERE